RARAAQGGPAGAARGRLLRSARRARRRGRVSRAARGRVRTAYLGTSDFAVTVLRKLAASSHSPTLVLTPPDSRRGRGRRAQPPRVAAVAGELSLDLVQAEDVNASEVLDRIRAAAPEAVVVCAFGQLIREPLLSEFELLNVHPSLLPRWRGAAP